MAGMASGRTGWLGAELEQAHARCRMGGQAEASAPRARPQVMRRAHWDEEREVWVLERLSDVGRRDGGVLKRPVSAAGQRRPISDYAKAATAAGDMNPRCARTPPLLPVRAQPQLAAALDIRLCCCSEPRRFRSENILSLELDLPERTTCDFEPGVPEAQAQVGGAWGRGS
jgi:hypothetical protein